MKILRQIIKSILAMLIFLALIINTPIKTFSSTNGNSSFKFAVMLADLNGDINTELKNEFENLQKEKQIKVSVYGSQNNVSIQDEILDSLLKSKPDLIIARLIDAREEAVRNFIPKVKSQNIPLILFDIEPEVVKKVSNLYSKVAFISSDSKKAGEVQGELIRDLWMNKSIIDKNGDGILQYVLVSGPLRDLISNQRTQCAISAIENSGIKTEKLISLNTDWSKEVAKSFVENIFLTYSNKIEAIITNSDDLAIGSVEALQKYGYNTGKNSNFIPVFGVGGIPEAKELIDKGIISGTVILDLKELANDFYAVGMNLVKNVSPTENTNLKIDNNGIIIILQNPKKYINKVI